jgi:organic hydroperoxide reductase OsmC/OhrA
VLIQANVENEQGRHGVVLATDGTAHSLAISPRASGFGSVANGGELLCLAMATCYCNDVYREAGKRAIEIIRVDVQARAEFAGPGAPAKRLAYRVTVAARATEDVIRELILHTDRVAEVQNTLRLGMPVLLESFDAVSMGPA